MILILSSYNYLYVYIFSFKGGFYGKSDERKRELRESCKVLGIPSGNIIIIEHRYVFTYIRLFLNITTRSRI